VVRSVSRFAASRSELVFATVQTAARRAAQRSPILRFGPLNSSRPAERPWNIPDGLFALDAGHASFQRTLEKPKSNWVASTMLRPAWHPPMSFGSNVERLGFRRSLARSSSMKIAVERVGNQVSLLQCIGSIWVRSSCFLPGHFANSHHPRRMPRAGA
jgi:hypothetical protein